MAWAFRLGSYLFTRILKDGKDKRFDNVRDNPLRFFSFWTIQGTYLSMHTDLLNFGCTPFDFVGAHCAGIKQNLSKPHASFLSLQQFKRFFRLDLTVKSWQAGFVYNLVFARDSN